MTLTLADLRAVFVGACYILGTVIALVVAVPLLGAAVHGWLAALRDAGRLFDPCGLLDYHGQPCMSPADHSEREHATGWTEVDDRFDLEERHRFDDTAAEGRFERRFKRGHLARVTRTGDTVRT